MADGEESPFVVKARHARRQELMDAKSLKDDELIDSPALKVLREDATTRYQRVTDAHTTAKIKADEQRLFRLARDGAIDEAAAAAAAAPRVHVGPTSDLSSKKSDAREDLKTPTSNAALRKRSLSTRSVTPQTMTQILESLHKIVDASWTRLYYHDNHGQKTGEKYMNKVTAAQSTSGHGLNVWILNGTSLECSICSTEKDLVVCLRCLLC